MDVARAFTYVFHDEEWLKEIGTGGLIMLIPIVNLVVPGYAIRALRNAREGRDTPLPKWDNWGHDLLHGPLIAIGMVIYGLPALIAVLLGMAAAQAFGEQACMRMGLWMGMLWALLVAFITPALYLQYAKHDGLGALFHFGEIWHIMADRVGNYVVAVLMTLVAMIVAGVVGGGAAYLIAKIDGHVSWSIFCIEGYYVRYVVCVIVASASVFYATLVSAHLAAQVQPAAAL